MPVLLFTSPVRFTVTVDDAAPQNLVGWTVGAANSAYYGYARKIESLPDAPPDDRTLPDARRNGKIAAILTRDDNMNLRYRRRRAGCAKHTRCAYGSAIARFRRQAAHSARAASERSA